MKLSRKEAKRKLGEFIALRLDASKDVPGIREMLDRIRQGKGRFKRRIIFRLLPIIRVKVEEVKPYTDVIFGRQNHQRTHRWNKSTVKRRGNSRR